MSRQIDPDNLSEDDIEYIKQRPNLRQEFILQGYGDPVETGPTRSDDFDDSSTIDDLDNEDSEEEDENEDDEDDESEPDDDYDNWKKDELVAEATKRGLDTSGNKSDIAQRLRDSDEG